MKACTSYLQWVVRIWDLDRLFQMHAWTFVSSAAIICTWNQMPAGDLYHVVTYRGPINYCHLPQWERSNDSRHEMYSVAFAIYLYEQQNLTNCQAPLSNRLWTRLYDMRNKRSRSKENSVLKLHLWSLQRKATSSHGRSCNMERLNQICQTLFSSLIHHTGKGSCIDLTLRYTVF